MYEAAGGRLYAHAGLALDAARSPATLALAGARLLARWGRLQAGVAVDPVLAGAPLRAHMRLVYCDAWRGAGGRPESVELALTLADNGSALALSLFRHAATRVNAVPFCYWSNMAGAAVLEVNNVGGGGGGGLVEGGGEES